MSQTPYVVRAQVTLDALPVVDLKHGPRGHKGELTAAERAKLEAMRDQVITLLKGNGLSRHWLSERSGVALLPCSRWLAEIGAVRSSSLYRLPDWHRRNRYTEWI